MGETGDDLKSCLLKVMVDAADRLCTCVLNAGLITKLREFARFRAGFFLSPARSEMRQWVNIAECQAFFRLCFSHSCHGSRLAPMPDVVVVHAEGSHPEKPAQVPAGDYS